MEVIVSFTILAFMMLVILRTTMTVGDSNASMESFNTVLLETQKATTQMRQDIATARKLYEENTLGRSYFDALQFGSHPPLTSSLLPLVLNVGEFDRDAVGNRFVGNVLLMAGEVSPHDFTYSGQPYRVNVYRLIGWYLADYGTPIATGLSGFDLIRWESEAFVDWASIMAITDPTTREALVDDLKNGAAKVNFAWDPNQVVDNAFFKLDTDVSPVPETSFKIPASRVADRVAKGYYRRRNGAIAPNNQWAATEGAVPKFAQRVDAVAGNPGFPHGFEVKIVGFSGARRVKTRIVAERMMRNKVFRNAAETIATMRDI
jgi:hypothetical protein